MPDLQLEVGPDQGPVVDLPRPIDGRSDLNPVADLPQVFPQDARPLDKPLADQQPQPPVRWVVSGAIANEATCPGPDVVGGGGSCSSDVPLMKLTPSAPSYQTKCQGTSVKTWAACPLGLGPLCPDQSVEGAETAVASCGACRLVGGGCDCVTGMVLGSYPDSLTGWRCTCSPGSAARAYAVCAATGGPWKITYQVALTCPAGALLAGGCNCTTTGQLVSSTPDTEPFPTSWSCGCTKGVSPTPTLLCIEAL